MKDARSDNATQKRDLKAATQDNTTRKRDLKAATPDDATKTSHKMGEQQTQRCYEHDYHERCIYLVTVVTVDRLPLLGKVVGDTQKAQIELSAVGKAVWREIEALSKRFPHIKVLQHQIMPDHVHLVLYVTERLPEWMPLGNVVAAWKQGCGKEYSAIRDLKDATPNNQQSITYTNGFTLGLSGKADFRSPAPVYTPLFEKGFNDRILTGKGQLAHIMAYVRDNPRRLLIKRQCASFFTIRRNITVAEFTFDAVGNMALLQKPLVAVHCHRRWSEQETQAYTAQCLEVAQKGAVLIGAFISKAEQAIAHEAYEQRLPLIHLMENGFNELYKPVGLDFYACAEGRLLQLAPWPYHNDKRPITRQQCQELNGMAEVIASYAT